VSPPSMAALLATASKHPAQLGPQFSMVRENEEVTCPASVSKTERAMRWSAGSRTLAAAEGGARGEAPGSDLPRA